MKDVLQIVFVCIAVLYTYNFVSGLIQGKENSRDAVKWIGRGYCFGLGLTIVFVIIFFVAKFFNGFMQQEPTMHKYVNSYIVTQGVV